MTIYRSSILLLTTVLSLASCTGDSKETASDGQMTIKQTEKVEATRERTMESVVTEYLSIKNALVASDAKSAKASAVTLLSVVDATKMPEVQQKTKEMAAVTDLDSLRVRFDSLSVTLYEQVKAHPDSSQILYKQYCPMAFDNRGAFWLSSEKEIKNPYFGDKMLTCGQVEEQITF